MLTIEQFRKIPNGTVFAKGQTENSPEGVFMSDKNIGKQMLWAAKKGYDDDWVVYIFWAEMGIDFVLSNGDKVFDPANIQKLVPCEQALLKIYRK